MFLLSLQTSVISSKYCSSCAQKRLLSCFLSDASNPESKVLATCALCRASKARSKRKALQPLDPNVPSKRRARGPPKALPHLEPVMAPPNPPKSRPEHPIPLLRLEAPIPIPPNPPESRPETAIPIPAPPPIQPQAPGFLPADQWASIQSFNRAMEQVKMESCGRCKERWFCMDLKSDVCHRCFN